MSNKEDFPSFDSLISYPLSHKIVPYLRKLNITPNQITVFNFFFRLGILSLYYNNINFIIITLLLIVSQIIDCMDGAMARKYSMGSELGKKLDINSDIIFRVIFYNVIAFKNTKLLNASIIIFIIDIILSTIHRNNDNKTRHIEMNGPIVIIISMYLLHKFSN